MSPVHRHNLGIKDGSVSCSRVGCNYVLPSISDEEGAGILEKLANHDDLPDTELLHEYSLAKDEEILKASMTHPILFEILVQRYQTSFHRAAWRILRDREEAEDALQEAFTRMYEHANDFEKREGIEFKSWAYKVVINTTITHYRRLKQNEHIPEDHNPSVEYQRSQYTAEPIRVTEDDIKRKMEMAEVRGKIDRGLKKMPAHFSELLAKFYLQEKSYKEICQEEGISLSVLKMRIFRARNYFRDHIEKLYLESEPLD